MRIFHGTKRKKLSIKRSGKYSRLDPYNRHVCVWHNIPSHWGCAPNIMLVWKHVTAISCSTWHLVACCYLIIAVSVSLKACLDIAHERERI